MSLPKTIFCDEAGFTGSDLFSNEQPFFVFASVAIEPEEAKNIITKTIRDFRIQSLEIKGRNIVRTSNGKGAALEIIERFINSASIFAFDKKYALSAKLFEYIFEPVLASKNYIFYEIGFNRFVSCLLYLHLLVHDAISETILIDFQSAMRSKDFKAMENILCNGSNSTNQTPIITGIITFVISHQEIIKNEITNLRSDPTTTNWVLELSITSLFNLLARWGENIKGGMEVFCDVSKPITSQADFFNAMLNREDRVFFDIRGKTIPITFNLAKPIQTVNSKDSHGVQIADVFASSFAYALKNPDEEFSQRCVELSEHLYYFDYIYPEMKFADPNEYDCYLNTLVFNELIDRTKRSENLLSGIENYILQCQKLFPLWRRI